MWCHLAPTRCCPATKWILTHSYSILCIDHLIYPHKPWKYKRFIWPSSHGTHSLSNGDKISDFLHNHVIREGSLFLPSQTCNPRFPWQSVPLEMKLSASVCHAQSVNSKRHFKHLRQHFYFNLGLVGVSSSVFHIARNRKLDPRNIRKSNLDYLTTNIY